MARVLVVDDEVIITMQLKERISSMGHKVVGIASNGEEAIAKARSTKPDIILMDIVMPGKTNGIAAAKVINKELDIPVIFITSHADDKTIREVKKVNPYGYILKPFNDLELKATIELALFRKSDVSDRKRAEDALRQMSADHKVIIDHAPAMIWYKDTKNNFVRVNPAGARAFGMAIEEIEGKNTYDLFPDCAEKYCDDDREVLSSGKPRLGIIEPMTTASGENLWVQSDKIPLKNEDGNITGILVFAVDITERKRAEDALALASRKLTLLSSITRHDIINQLAALNGYLALSQDILGDPVKLAEFITKEQNIASTIEAQIRFTKDYQDVGIKAPVWQNVHDSVAAAKERLPLRGIAVDTDSSTFEVYADPLLVRVFYNLIDNALRYGGEQMTMIRISQRKSNRGLVIVCEDDGVGIPSGKKEAIFNRGYFKHTGFGLYLSREILSITDITITENGVPGKGARFEIHVPAGMWRKKGANQ